MSRFKVNDKVVVNDKSWSRVINLASESRHISRTFSSGAVRIFKVLAVAAKIPVEGNATANTLIMDIDSEEIIAINDCNLSKEPMVEIRFYSGGIDVTKELSEQSRRAVLRANNY